MTGEPGRDTEYLQVDEIDAEVETLEQQLAIARAEQARLQRLLSDPVEQLHRRLALRDAMASWVEALNLNEDYLRQITGFLAPDVRWITQEKPMLAGGWVVRDHPDGSRRWALKLDRAPAIPVAEAEDPEASSGE